PQGRGGTCCRWHPSTSHWHRPADPLRCEPCSLEPPRGPPLKGDRSHKNGDRGEDAWWKLCERARTALSPPHAARRPSARWPAVGSIQSRVCLLVRRGEDRI